LPHPESTRLEPTSEEDYRRWFRGMDTMQLVDTWEQPLPPRARELLLAEIKKTGYRIKSLPEPPSSEGVGPVAAASGEAQAARSVRARSGWILTIGLLQLLVGTWIGIANARACSEQLAALEGRAGDERVELEGEEMEVRAARFTLRLQQIAVFAVSWTIGVLFLALYVWSRYYPRPALITALATFVVIHVLEAMFDPPSLPRMVFKVLVVGTLMAAVLASKPWRRPAARAVG